MEEEPALLFLSERVGRRRGLPTELREVVPVTKQMRQAVDCSTTESCAPNIYSSLDTQVVPQQIRFTISIFIDKRRFLSLFNSARDSDGGFSSRIVCSCRIYFRSRALANCPRNTRSNPRIPLKNRLYFTRVSHFLQAVCTVTAA